MARSNKESIELHLPDEYKKIIERAAKVVGVKLDDFIVGSSCEAARLILIDEAASKLAAQNSDGQIMQFKVSLKYIQPLIWRRIQVPASYTFYDLHSAIQDMFNWGDYHLNQFRPKVSVTGKPVYIGIPDSDPFPEDVEDIPGWEVPLTDYFRQPKDVVEYEYDFGDSWLHAIELEKILPREPKVKYPRCIDGRRNGPPEDCGGIGGYQNMIEALASRKHPEHKRVLEWIGSFDPEAFDAAKIKFEDPRKRFKRAFQD